MDAELKKKWIDALRSGDYQQGTGALRSGALHAPSYCCLGVLCDVVNPKGWEEGHELEKDDDRDNA